MATIPFVGGNYTDRSLNLNCQITQNMFPVVDKLRKVISMYGVPGLSEWWVDELVVNGKFDDYPTVWEYLAWDVADRTLYSTVTNIPSLDYCLYVACDTIGQESYVYQDLVGLISGRSYHGSAYLRGNNLTSGNFIMKLGTQAFDTHPYSNGSWVKLDGVITWDGVSTELMVGVTSVPGNPSKVFYIDDVSVYHA